MCSTVAPDNQQALVMLLLAVTDRIAKGYGVSDTQAKEILDRITGDYERAYYSGILAERRAKMKLAQGAHGAIWAYDLLREAMECYEKAEGDAPGGKRRRASCVGTPARASSRRTSWCRARKRRPSRPSIESARGPSQHAASARRRSRDSARRADSLGSAGDRALRRAVSPPASCRAISRRRWFLSRYFAGSRDRTCASATQA